MNKGYTKEDRLMSEIMKDFPMEAPSADFTDRVMQAVEQAGSASHVESRPLISRGGWIGIAASMTALILYILFGGSTVAAPESQGFLDRLPSLSIPEGFGMNTLFDKINLDSPALMWTFTAIGGLLLLAFIERMIEGIRERYFFH